MSGSEFVLSKFLLGFAIYFLAHLSVSYSNDYFDLEVDAFSDPTPISGGSGILLRNLNLREFSKRFALFLMALSIIFAVFFIRLFMFPITFLVFVLLGNLLGWFYTAPPLRLSYRGFSEVTVMVIIGLMIPGMSYFIQKGAFDSLFMAFAFPSMLYGLAFILSVEIPDLEGDSLWKKNTLIVRTDRKVGFLMIASAYVVVTAYFSVFSLITPLFFSLNFRFISLLSLLPSLMGLYSLRRRTDDREIATSLATNNVLVLFLFIVLINLYLLGIVFHLDFFPIAASVHGL